MVNQIILEVVGAVIVIGGTLVIYAIKSKKFGHKTKDSGLKTILKDYKLKQIDTGIQPKEYLTKKMQEEIDEELLRFGYIWDDDSGLWIHTAGMTKLDTTSIVDAFDMFDERITKLEKAIKELKTIQPKEPEQPKEPKKLDIDLEWFKIPRTPEEVVEKLGLSTKQGLYLKMTSLGVSKNDEDKYFIP